MKTVRSTFFYCFVAILLSAAVVENTSLPSFIKPCSRSSPNLNKCLLNVSQSVVGVFTRGIPEMEIPTLDPVSLKKIIINIPGLQVMFDNVTLSGLGDGRINDFKMNLDKGKALIDFTSNLTMKGQYKVDGRVLILPVRGDGDFVNLLTNMNLVIKYSIETVKGSDGKDHWKFAITKRSYKLDKAFFDFENLFGGNKILSEPTLRFLNENWEVIMSDVSPPAVDQIISACLKVINKFHAKVPLDELMTP